jgi:hypothetical protein
MGRAAHSGTLIFPLLRARSPTFPARYTKIDIAVANQLIGRLTHHTVRYITIRAP